MNSCDRSHQLVRLFTILLFFASYSLTYANGEYVREEESTSILVGSIISILGGLVAILGVYIVYLGRRGGSSNVHVTLGKDKSIRLTNLTQGVVVVLIGAAILMFGIYKLPFVKKSETLKAKEIQFDKDGRINRARH